MSQVKKPFNALRSTPFGVLLIICGLAWGSVFQPFVLLIPLGFGVMAWSIWADAMDLLRDLLACLSRCCKDDDER